MAKKINVKITSRFGFHARPASAIMDIVCKYDCQAVVAYDYEEYDFSSFSDIMQMNIPCGEVVEIIARGKDEAIVIEKIEKEIIDRKVGEII